MAEERGLKWFALRRMTSGLQFAGRRTFLICKCRLFVLHCRTTTTDFCRMEGVEGKPAKIRLCPPWSSAEWGEHEPTAGTRIATFEKLHFFPEVLLRWEAEAGGLCGG